MTTYTNAFGILCKFTEKKIVISYQQTVLQYFTLDFQVAGICPILIFLRMCPERDLSPPVAD